MLGFVIGTLCLVGLIKTLHWGHRHHAWAHGGCGSAWAGHGCGGYEPSGPWGYHHRGFGGPNVLLRGLFQRLDTTPGQEKVIMAAIDELRTAAQKARGEGRATRADVAKAVRSPGFDEVLFGEMFARHDTTIEELRKAAVGALAKIHDALDEKQRARLADLVENGPGFFHGPFATL